MKKHSQKITPCLWFDNQAEEASRFYLDAFGDGEILRTAYYGEGFPGEKGTVMLVEFRIFDMKFVALNGGPHFSMNPSISFFVTCANESETDLIWERLSEGGQVLMPLDKYPWSEKYGWVQDRYGASWQIATGKVEEVGQRIAISLLFVGDQAGRAEEAMDLYTSTFEDSEVVGILRYDPGEGEKEKFIKHAQFKLNGEVFMAMDSSLAHEFSFNPGISLVVDCKSQKEVDHFWERLSQGGDEKAQQCGWLADRFGVSWQVVPDVVPKLLRGGDAEKVNRVTQALLKMKKLDVAELERAYAEG